MTVLGRVLLFLRHWFRPNSLGDVYTPTTTAKLAYVSRKTLESNFIKYLHLAGKQIILYGHSGSGKTTLVDTILKQRGMAYITTHCESSTTFNDLLINAFDELELFYRSEISNGKKFESEAEISAELNAIGAAIKQIVSEEHQETYVRVLPPQLTPQRLSETLGKLKLIWVIEDFHKVDDAEKKRIADVIKIFIDKANKYPQLKIICIGAVDTARDMIKLDPNLSTRVSELSVPLLTEEEILEIINQGCKCLNIEMTQPLKDKIMHYSNRLASLAHQMCYDICYSNEIMRTCKWSVCIGDDRFRDAIESYLDSNSDTFKSIYEASVKDPIGWYILKTFTVHGQNKLSIKNIKKRICNKKHSFADNDINLKLLELSSGQNNILRYDANSGKYSISSPFWGAFLKMQIAIEEANQAKAEKDKRNVNLLLENQDDADALLLQILLKRYEMRTLIRN